MYCLLPLPRILLQPLLPRPIRRPRGRCAARGARAKRAPPPRRPRLAALLRRQRFEAVCKALQGDARSPLSRKYPCLTLLVPLPRKYRCFTLLVASEAAIAMDEIVDGHHPSNQQLKPFPGLHRGLCKWHFGFPRQKVLPDTFMAILP